MEWESKKRRKIEMRTRCEECIICVMVMMDGNDFFVDSRMGLFGWPLELFIYSKRHSH